jgi:protein-tyrosine-phosphatase
MASLTSDEFRDLAVKFQQQHGRKLVIGCVCTGNTCRSAACDDILTKLFGNTATIISGGTGVRTPGAKMTPMVNNVLNKMPNGKQVTPSSQHKSKSISEIDLTKADIIFAMEDHHKKAILEQFPGIASKIVVLGIADPWQPDNVLRATPTSAQHGANYSMVRELTGKLKQELNSLFMRGGKRRRPKSRAKRKRATIPQTRRRRLR